MLGSMRVAASRNHARTSTAARSAKSTRPVHVKPAASTASVLVKLATRGRANSLVIGLTSPSQSTHGKPLALHAAGAALQPTGRPLHGQ